jgi:hypothetical protein
MLAGCCRINTGFCECPIDTEQRTVTKPFSVNGRRQVLDVRLLERSTLDSRIITQASEEAWHE